MSHTRTVCPHGVVVSQCRCIKPHKVTKVVACPFDHHTGPTWEAREQVQQLAGAPGTPTPVSLGGPGAPGAAEDIYRGAMNRYFRNAEFARKVDQTVQLAMTALGQDFLGEAGERDLRLGVMFGVYQAGG